VLASLLDGFSRARLQALIREGAVQVDGKVVTRASHKLAGGEQLQVEVPEVKSGRLEGQDIPLDVRYEDGDVVVLVKPSGMAVHPSRGHRDGTLVNALIHRYPGLLEIGGE